MYMRLSIVRFKFYQHKHLSKNLLLSYYSSYSIAITIRLETYVPDTYVTLLVSN